MLALCLGSLALAEEKKEEKKPEKPAAEETKRRPSDVVFLLIEMSDADEEAAKELQRLYEVLRKLDKNNDGKITAEALKAAREQLIEERVEHIIRKLDTDKDGQISKDEAQGRIKEHFEQLDLNKDGYISRDELRRAISARGKAPEKSTPPKE
jgi:Ca2+-binding EF-hand superfamily protein